MPRFASDALRGIKESKSFCFFFFRKRRIFLYPSAPFCSWFTLHQGQANKHTRRLIEERLEHRRPAFRMIMRCLAVGTGGAGDVVRHAKHAARRLQAWALACLLVFLLAERAEGACSFSVVGANFGTQTGSASTPGATPVTINCPSGSGWQVGVNAGLHSGGNYNWNMQNSSDSTLMNYSLYRDSARSQLLGGTQNFDTLTGTGTGSSQTAYIYPKLPANSAITPGSYSDSVTLTLYNSGGNLTTTMSVAATVVANCTVSAGNLAFGVYTGAASTSATATLSATCTNTTSYQIGADLGQHSQFGWLFMMGPGGTQNTSNILQYHLYQDSAHTQVWGNTQNSNEISGTGTGSTQSITVYGVIGTGHYEVNPGAFTDTVTVTINF